MYLLKIVLYFVVFSFCGWISETIICSYNEKRFVKRGFLTGPFIPVYGFGGLIFVVLLEPLQNNPFLLYIAGVILATILEYVTALLMESLFKIKLWDYSGKKYNLHGRVWLVSSLFFGILGMAGTYLVNPPLSRHIDSLSTTTVKILGFGFLAYFLLDTINSVVTLASLRTKIRQIGQELEAQLAHAKETLQQEFETFQLEKMSKTTWSQRRFLRAYPKMSSMKNTKTILYLREQLETYRKEQQAKRDLKKQAKKSPPS